MERWTVIKTKDAAGVRCGGKFGELFLNFNVDIYAENNTN
jgi:hypothetical protein